MQIDLQPMNTAPTDGKPFLVVHDDGVMAVAYYLANPISKRSVRGFRPRYSHSSMKRPMVLWAPMPRLSLVRTPHA